MMRRTGLDEAQRYIASLERQLKASKPAMSQEEADAIRIANAAGYGNNEIAAATQLNNVRYLDRVWHSRSKSVVSQILNRKTWQSTPVAIATHKFIHGDCISEMQKLPRQSIDLVVTSPPYRAGKNYGTDYDDQGSLEDYRNFATAWLTALVPLLKDTGSLWLNIGHTIVGPNETLPLTYLYYPIAESLGLKLVQEVVWHYEGGKAYKQRFAHRTERWMWLSLDPSTCYFDLDAVRDPTLNRTIDRRNHPLGKNPTDYWYFDRVVGGRGSGAKNSTHPAQFPQAMVERIIQACSKPSDVVLDPFSGSGTSTFAARSLARSSISIEQNERFHRAFKEAFKY